MNSTQETKECYCFKFDEVLKANRTIQVNLDLDLITVPSLNLYNKSGEATASQIASP